MRDGKRCRVRERLSPVARRFPSTTCEYGVPPSTVPREARQERVWHPLVCVELRRETKPSYAKTEPRTRNFFAQTRTVQISRAIIIKPWGSLSVELSWWSASVARRFDCDCQDAATGAPGERGKVLPPVGSRRGGTGRTRATRELREKGAKSAASRSEHTLATCREATCRDTLYDKRAVALYLQMNIWIGGFQ